MDASAASAESAITVRAQELTRHRFRTNQPAIEVAQGLLESVAAEYEYENYQEREYELADRLAVAWGRSTFTERLLVAKNLPLRFYLEHPSLGSVGCTDQGVAELAARLVDLGPDWVMLQATDMSAHGSWSHPWRNSWQSLVPIERLISVAGLPNHVGASKPTSRIWESQRLTQILRPISEARQVAFIHSDIGCFAGEILRVGKDHLDLSPRNPAQSGQQTITIRFSAIAIIEAEFTN